MSESKSVTFGLGSLVFWGFVGIKVMGHLFAAWSWWWIFCPIIPWVGVAVDKLNL